MDETVRPQEQAVHGTGVRGRPCVWTRRGAVAALDHHHEYGAEAPFSRTCIVTSSRIEHARRPDRATDGAGTSTPLDSQPCRRLPPTGAFPRRAREEPSHVSCETSLLQNLREGAYRQYSTEEQSAFATASARPGHSPNMNWPGGGWRRQTGCSASRMQRDLHHGLLEQRRGDRNVVRGL